MIRRTSLFLVAFFVVVLDQISKGWIQRSLYPGQSTPEDGFVRLTYVTNTGAAFGLFPDQTMMFIIVAALVIGAIIVYYRYMPYNGFVFMASLGLQLGGALGNLTDRLRHGYVIDFIDFRFWPVFNLADSAIVVGVAILAYFILIPGKASTLATQECDQRS